jgi:hypothetical protein
MCVPLLKKPKKTKKSGRLPIVEDTGMITDALVMRILVSSCHGDFIDELEDAGKKKPYP